jgi:alpha-beta hydrolase superfamily lysophospholipase
MRRRTLLGAAPLLLSACAPLAQVAGTPPPGFSGARLEPDRFVAQDGTRLGLTVWPAEGLAEPSAVIVALHGMNDYAEAFTLAAPIWAAEGVTTYAFDQRGFGRSPQRGVWGGTELMVEDLRTLTRLVRERHPQATLTVVGESMGGAVSIVAFGSERPPDADRLVLIAPAVWGWDAQPLLYKTSLWLGAHTFPAYAGTPPRAFTRGIVPCDNIEHLRRMRADDNLLFRTRIDAVYGLVGLMQRARTGVGAIRRPPPVFYAYGMNDHVIREEPSVFAARQLRRGDRSAHYERGYHMLTRDLQGPVVSRDILSFIRDPDGPLPSGAPPIRSARERSRLSAAASGRKPPAPPSRQQRSRPT